MTESYYVRVLVHGTIPAEGAAEALSLLCARIRDGHLVRREEPLD